MTTTTTEVVVTDRPLLQGTSEEVSLLLFCYKNDRPCVRGNNGIEISSRIANSDWQLAAVPLGGASE